MQDLLNKAALRAHRQAELDWAKNLVVKCNPILEDPLPWETESQSQSETLFSLCLSTGPGSLTSCHLV